MHIRKLGLCAFLLLLLGVYGCGGGSSSTSNNINHQTPPPSGVPRSGISHLIIVVMQNNSFDHLFGTYSGARGLDPTAPSYKQTDKAGNTVQPSLLTTLVPPPINHTQTSYSVAYDSGKMDKYAWENGDVSMGYWDNTSVGQADDGRTFGINTLWNYSQQYALADNFFASAMASEPSNMLYMVSGDVGTGSDPFGYPQLDSCTASLYQQNKSIGATITPPLSFTNVGDQLTANRISWGFYQEYFSSEQNGSCSHYVPQENPFQYFQSTANSSVVQNFTTPSFNNMLASGSLPSVMWVQPSPLHTMHPGAGNVLDGVEWLDDFVNSVKASSSWSTTAILVLWDESGGWYDHVAPPQLANSLGLGARVPVLVISPLAKTNYISHQQMDFVSILRFIQYNWALGPLPASTPGGAREQLSGDICDLLTSTCGAP